MDEIMERMMAKIEQLEARLPPVATPVAPAPVKTRKISCCSKCGKEGHYKNFCPTNNAPAPPLPPTPPPLPPTPPPLPPTPAPVARAVSVASDESFDRFSHDSSPANVYIPVNYLTGKPVETDERCVEWFDKLMTKIPIDFTPNPDAIIWMLLKTLYSTTKQSFHVVGGLHTDTSARLYYSVKVVLADRQYATIHIYGSTRFENFIVNQASVMMNQRKHEFQFVKRTPSVRG
jgi:hypothetical protein